MSFQLNRKHKFVEQLIASKHTYLGLVKRNAVNLLIFLISLCGSAVFAYYVYNRINRPSEVAVYRGTGSDYALSFYNSQGQKITELSGTLKLVTDPFTIYGNYPNQKSSSYSINAHGFREGYANENYKKSLAVVLGGSATFGQGLPDNSKTFASLISSSHFFKNSSQLHIKT